MNLLPIQILVAWRAREEAPLRLGRWSAIIPLLVVLVVIVIIGIVATGR